jgi:hypothetical protein
MHLLQGQRVLNRRWTAATRHDDAMDVLGRSDHQQRLLLILRIGRYDN